MVTFPTEVKLAMKSTQRNSLLELNFIILKIERRCSFTNEIKNIKEVFSLNIFRVISPSSGVYRLKLASPCNPASWRPE